MKLNGINMRHTIKVEKEIEIKTLIAKVAVRYYEDATVNGIEDIEGNLIPCKEGNLWCPIIHFDSGIICNWKEGVEAKIHYKVCDEGNYYLQDDEGNTVLSIEENYVPEIMCPNGQGYGDYIIMDVDKNGQIANWNPTLDGFIYED